MVPACAKLITSMLGFSGWLHTGSSQKSPPTSGHSSVNLFFSLSHVLLSARPRSDCLDKIAPQQGAIWCNEINLRCETW